MLVCLRVQKTLRRYFDGTWLPSNNIQLVFKVRFRKTGQGLLGLVTLRVSRGKVENIQIDCVNNKFNWQPVSL